MPQKPIHKRSRINSRAAVWDAIRAQRTFTVRDVWAETSITKDTVRDYLKGLEAAGYIERLDTSHGRTATWQLIADPGPEPPRVRADGSEITQGKGRLQLWRAMRVLGRFDVKELAINASTEDHQVALGEARTYCQFLERAGYLKRRGQIYHLVDYTGPRPPQIQRIKQVWDANTHTIRFSQGGDQ
jgi:hypothetical protein